MYSQELEVRPEMHVEMAQFDYPVRRAEGEAPYRIVDLDDLYMHF